MSNVKDLNPADIGHALVRLAMISRLMGHSDPASTARDYLLPHGDHTPEWRFVMDMVTGRNPMDDEEAGQALMTVDLPPLPGV